MKTNLSLTALLLLLCLVSSGCSHVSETHTVFEGKTTGINPYGNGDIKVERYSYWGTNAGIIKALMKIRDDK